HRTEIRVEPKTPSSYRYSTTTELKLMLRSPAFVLHALKGAFVRNWASSVPTRLPALSKRRAGAKPPALVPTTVLTPRRPYTLAWKLMSVQDAPRSIWPTNVILPRHPGPPRGPVARNRRGTEDGVVDTPGALLLCPVGAAGVPPQVHAVAPCAVAAPPASCATAARTTHAVTALDLIPCSFPQLPDGRRLAEPYI